MNVTFPFSDQLVSTWDAAKSYLSDGLTQLGSQIAAGFGVEHDVSTNKHSTINASGPISERGRTTPMGVEIVPAFVSSNFTCATAADVWTVNANASSPLTPVSYWRVGLIVMWNLYVVQSSVTNNSGSLKTLQVALPPGMSVPPAPSGAFPAHGWIGAGEIFNNGTHYPATLFMNAGQTTVGIGRLDNGTLATDASTNVRGQIWFPVQS